MAGAVEEEEEEDELPAVGPASSGEDEEQEECPSRVVPRSTTTGGEAPAAPRPLADAFMELFGLPSMSQARRAVRTGQVFVEGVKRKANFCVSGGERIEWRQRREGAPTLDRSLVPEDLQKAFRVVYEDDDVAVVWKPPGVDTAGGSSGSWSALGLSHHFLRPSAARGAYRRARAVHRLDAPTAGLVCLAKTQPAHLKLAKAFEERDVHKTYLALLVGPPLEPPSGRIEAPLKCLLPGKGGVMQEAVTEYEMLQFTAAPTDLGGGLATVRFRPLTGRTHQLRRHAARDLGRPILGDSRYGDGIEPEEVGEARDLGRPILGDSRYGNGIEPEEVGEACASDAGRLFLAAVGLDLPSPSGHTVPGSEAGRLQLSAEEPPEFEARRRAAAEAAVAADAEAARQPAGVREALVT